MLASNHYITAVVQIQNARMFLGNANALLPLDMYVSFSHFSILARNANISIGYLNSRINTKRFDFALISIIFMVLF